MTTNIGTILEKSGSVDKKNNKLFHSRITITYGGHAGVSFYKLAEEGLVGEVELFCNFFDGFVGVFQAVFDMLDGCFVD